MKCSRGKQIVVIPVLLACISAGCAPMTGVERDARAFAIAEFQAQFVLDQLGCEARGGRIEVAGDAVRLDRNGVPYSKTRYICVLPRS